MLQQNTDYEVSSFAEVSSIIHHFTPEMVNDVLVKAIETREVNFIGSKPNIPEALEANYRKQLEEYPQMSQEINSAKTEIYEYVISLLCNSFQLNFIGDESIDRYSAAFWLYDFLVSKFDKYLIEFLSSYIIRESDTFYQMLVTKEDRKDTTAYTRRVFKGDALAIGMIHANLEWVVDNMLAFDCDLPDIITTSFGPQWVSVSNFLNTIVVDSGDFFKRIYVPFILQNKALILTSIKFALQNRVGVDISDFTIKN